MSAVAQVRPVKIAPMELPERVRRDLLIGETIYHSTAACHRSTKHPEGKWVGQVRRTENGRLIKYPVKAFASPQLALAYVKSLRPNATGRVFAAAQGEATVADLFEFVKKHKWKRLSPKRIALKESRWRLHIEPFWGLWSLTQVTRRAAQEWVTDIEASIAAGKAGTLGQPQFSECRMDLHGMFDALGIFDERFEERKNPFADLECLAREQRHRVCIESQQFAAIELACSLLVAERLCTDWVVGMFLTALLSGLRLGEVLALCREQIDFSSGAIRVDRAVREQDRELDSRTMTPAGPIQRVAVNLPKGDKIRVVPISDQLAAILRSFCNRPCVEGAKWNLVFPSETGCPKEHTRLTGAFNTLCKRLDELAKKTAHGGRGWPRNPLIEEFRCVSLPDVWNTIVFRDTRNSFASYAEEAGIPQATREAILGHGAKGVTNKHYTDVTTKGFQDSRQRLTEGWTRRATVADLVSASA